VDSIVFALLFFWPAGAANSAPIFATKIKALDRFGKPIDGGRTFRGKRIFGDHKTIRGFIIGPLTGALAATELLVIYNYWSYFRDISPIDYSQPETILLGAIMGFGALVGDSVKSFFKRQVGVPSGKGWFPYDQIDYIVGGIAASLYYAKLDASDYIVIAVVWFVLHPISTFVGWLLRLKDSPI
jgi:CDP-2,3-bis-(O-geranylgeranyl)-sn-glycerol synthase